MIRKVVILSLAFATPVVGVFYIVSFLPAPEWRWQGRYFGYERFPAGGWPHRAITVSSEQTKVYLSIQTGNFWLEWYTYLPPSPQGVKTQLRELRFAGFILRKTIEDGFVFIPGRPMGGEKVLRQCARIPLWSLFILFALYPCSRFYCGPFRRFRRRRRGLCVKCAYNLTGNTSGVCPECGTAIDAMTGEESQSP